MAIYRPRSARWPLVLASILAGMVVGFVLGAVAFGARPADLAEAGERIQAELIAASGLLEVAAVEYREAVPAATVVSDAEYRGALDAVAAARGRVAAVTDALRAIDAARASAIDAAFDALEALMAAPAPADEVEAVIQALDVLLTGRSG